MPGDKLDILAQRTTHPRAWRPFGLAAWLLVVPTLGLVTAFGIVPGTATHDIVQLAILEALPPPPLTPAAQPELPFHSLERVQKGDTVAALLDRSGVRDARAMEFLRTDATGRMMFRRLIPGRPLLAAAGPEGELLRLQYHLSPESVLEVTRGESGFTARERRASESTRAFHRTAVIRSSLFAATDGAGIPDAIAIQIARVFSTDIDFHSDLRKGDRFSVVYEMPFESGEPIGPGRILAAEFTNAGRTYHAILFRDEDGKDSHYALDGSNRAKAFLRSPVEFSRVSSGFGARFHPIFRNWRAHTGVDFAAPTGTRVLSAADGVVIAAGSRGGYGNAVEVRHGGGITTLYGHLSRVGAGIRPGVRVRQSDVIGSVGATGWATGPHLHYEFKMSGIHQDPMKVALPKATPVAASLRPQFESAAAQARTALVLASTSVPSRFE